MPPRGKGGGPGPGFGGRGGGGRGRGWGPPPGPGYGPGYGPPGYGPPPPNPLSLICAYLIPPLGIFWHFRGRPDCCPHFLVCFVLTALGYIPWSKWRLGGATAGHHRLI